LNFISQFTTDIQHVSGKFNILADYLSRIEEIGFPDSIDYDKLQQQQETDEELKHFLKPNAITSIQLKKLQYGSKTTYVYCDMATELICLCERRLHNEAGRRVNVCSVHRRQLRVNRRTCCLRLISSS